jgi:hypothetical protein
MTNDKRFPSPRLCAALCILLISACIALQIDVRTGAIAAGCMSPLLIGAKPVERFAGWIGRQIEAVVRLLSKQLVVDVMLLSFVFAIPLAGWAVFLSFQGWTASNVGMAALWITTGVVIGMCVVRHYDKLGVGRGPTCWQEEVLEVAKALIFLSVIVIGIHSLVLWPPDLSK